MNERKAGGQSSSGGGSGAGGGSGGSGGTGGGGRMRGGNNVVDNSHIQLQDDLVEAADDFLNQYSQGRLYDYFNNSISFFMILTNIFFLSKIR